MSKSKKLYVVFALFCGILMVLFPDGRTYAATPNIIEGLPISGKYEGTDGDYDTGFLQTTNTGTVTFPRTSVKSIRLTFSRPSGLSSFYIRAYDGTTQKTYENITRFDGTKQQYVINYAEPVYLTEIHIVYKDTTVYELEVLAEPDITPPSVVTGLTGTAGDTKVNLSWMKNSEEDFQHYNVYRDGNKVATVPKANNSVEVSSLTNDKTYVFYVTAVDTSGNESKPSNQVSLTPKGPPPPDTTPPNTPVLNGKPGNKQAILDWTRNTESDLAGYNLYQGNDKIGTYTSNQATIDGLENGKTYKYRVTAIDASGNESAKSNEVSITPSDRLNVNLVPNGNSIIVQIISGGIGPYVIDWGNAKKTVDQTQYVISDLQFNTDYTVTITSANGLEYKATVNTGATTGYVPPTFPNPQELFQKMIDSFGTAGSIALAIIGGAIALGIICVLAMWGWRLLKRWLAKMK